MNLNENIPEFQGNQEEVSADALNIIFQEYLATISRDKQKVLLQQISKMNDDQKMQLANRIKEVQFEKENEENEEELSFLNNQQEYKIFNNQFNTNRYA